MKQTIAVSMFLAPLLTVPERGLDGAADEKKSKAPTPRIDLRAQNDAAGAPARSRSGSSN